MTIATTDVSSYRAKFLYILFSPFIHATDGDRALAMLFLLSFSDRRCVLARPEVNTCPRNGDRFLSTGLPLGEKPEETGLPVGNFRGKGS